MWSAVLSATEFGEFSHSLGQKRTLAIVMVVGGADILEIRDLA